MKIRLSLVFVLALSFLFLSSCGYHLLGTGGLPASVTSVAVPAFEKEVSLIVLDQRITEAVRAELARRARVRVTSGKDGADAVLSGTITNFSVSPLSYDSDGRANRYQVSLIARVILKDKDNKELFKLEGYRFEESYARSGSGNSYASEENVAYDTLARDFARALVGAIFESSQEQKK
jgi:outer membrane lipopolysaccharide assembly protein LptE/RlpB